MSCDECDKVFEQNLKGKNLAFMRVGKANVLIGACDFHFNELRKKLLGVKELKKIVRIKDWGEF